jgi:hypothetical protein
MDKGVCIMGTISIYRPQNNCGMGSLMEITINGISQPWTGTGTGTVADGATKGFNVPNGIYKVFVKLGVRSNTQEVSISSNSIALTATVIPDASGKIGISRVDLYSRMVPGTIRVPGENTLQVDFDE